MVPAFEYDRVQFSLTRKLRNKYVRYESVSLLSVFQINFSERTSRFAGQYFMHNNIVHKLRSLYYTLVLSRRNKTLRPIRENAIAITTIFHKLLLNFYGAHDLKW